MSTIPPNGGRFRRRTVVLTVVALTMAACSGTEDNTAEVDDTTAVATDDGATDNAASDDSSDAGPSTDRERNEITYGLSSDGTGFNTLDTVDPGAIRIAVSALEPLVSLDQDGVWKPYLAETFETNEDATLWTVTLRPGITFHDGEPLNAEAVKRNMDAFRLSPTTGFVFGLIDEITVVDDLTVEIAMKSPWAAFPYSLIGQAGWIVSPSSLSRNDQLMGTGPFVLESWTPNDGARVVRNENYWRADEGLPFLDAINFKVIPEQTARRQALEAGDIDAYISPADADLLEFRADDSVDVYQSELAGNEFLIVLNTTAAPANDIRIRQAMAHAVDRDLLIENFRSGLTRPANTFIDPDSRWYVETDYPAFDLERATELVADYEADNGDAAITFTSLNSSSTVEVAEFIASFWRDAGIDVEIAEVGTGAAIDRVIRDDFQAITWFQFSSTDPDGAWVFMNSAAGVLNWSNLADPELDNAFNIGRGSLDDAVRADAYATVQRELVKELPFLWMDHIGEIEALVSVPEIVGYADANYPDGTDGAGLVAGSFHPYANVRFIE